jgi:hypothetical protein
MNKQYGLFFHSINGIIPLAEFGEKGVLLIFLKIFNKVKVKTG